jgi:hypothetical protein
MQNKFQKVFEIIFLSLISINIYAIDKLKLDQVSKEQNAGLVKLMDDNLAIWLLVAGAAGGVMCQC